MLLTRPHINKLLLPLSWLYGAVVGFRNKLFDWGVLSSKSFPVPVISVGNLTVGGTGKTPHIEYLIRLLSPSYKVAVLSRGYKRTSRGFVLADQHANSKSIGDEPYQMYRKFPQILVAVDKKRVRGITALLALDKAIRPDIILLDDAYQHRYVKPSFSILLTDIHRLMYEDTLLPAGRLREPFYAKRRAQAVIVSKCPANLRPIDYRIITKHLHLYPYQHLFFSSFQYNQLRPVFSQLNLPNLSLSQLKEQNAGLVLLTGIANPVPLQNRVKDCCADVQLMSYPDHYSFTAKDIREIEAKLASLSSSTTLVITTEKDAARLVSRNDISETLQAKLYYLPIEVVFRKNESEAFNQKIYQHVKTVKRNRFLD